MSDTARPTSPAKPGRGWVVILGVSGGMGGACARAFAARGYHVFGVHLDRAEQQPGIDTLAAEIEAAGCRAVFANVNASRQRVIEETVQQVQDLTGADGGVRVVVHALAFGALAPLISDQTEQDCVTRRQMEMTLSVMAHSFVYWIQALWTAGLLSTGAKLFALTSIGSQQVVANYGAVSAAKCALEAHVRQLAFELAPHGIAVNAIRAGVTITPALLKIPGSEHLIARAERYNPHGKLTTPDDVGQAIAQLVNHSTSWMTGNIIGVDGGEKLSL